MLREALLLAAVLLTLLAAFVFVWAPHKALVVKRNHFFLKLFALLNLPPWLCRMIVPKAPAGNYGGVSSTDHAFLSTRDRRQVHCCVCFWGFAECPLSRLNQYRLYIPADEANSKDVLLWVHGGGFVLGSISGREQHFGPLS